MVLPTGPTNSWLHGTDFPSRPFETGRNDYELYEEDDEFVLSVELPGFDPGEISVSWDEGVLDVVAEHDDDRRDERKTYHRRFRVPKNVDDDEIVAQYTNGVLEVRLPVVTGASARGTEIEIRS